MYQTNEASSEEEQSQFFRCPIQAADGKATIRIGWKRIPVTVQETSIEGFTLTVPAKYTSRIQISGPWELVFADSRTEVHPQWFFNAPDGNAQLAVRRLRDLTKPDRIPSSWRIPFRGPRSNQNDNATIAFGGLVLAFIAVLSSSRIGEELGTAKYLQSAFASVCKGILETLRPWM
ncbi:hypothetical protein Pla52o_56280 [Novipirellula galeiformis]|uniref:Uncharacterized protein n=1 Tax=Novipirellula galeiformis TaxID=2528004 RepID=A0A5C6BGW1_9BACT|nr:hypothetical protein [Novipirellula galeiformis]TWU11190.1 hypothetical protein Pla52o_56280 [Novipirellula galeiformis]